ncbi:MAG: O-antigen ligase family protein, partial [Rhodoglobus sp.]
ACSLRRQDQNPRSPVAHRSNVESAGATVTTVERTLDVARGVVRSARFTQAVTLSIIGTAFFTHLLRQVIGWPGLIAIVVALCVVVVVSLGLDWRERQWGRLVPVSVICWLGWVGLSLLWSQYQWVTLGGLAYLFAFTILGIYVAIFRDTIQIVRAFGDVLRLVVALSLAVELLSGVLLDAPFEFLWVRGSLAEGGPIQGVMGTRNALGLIAIFALITFAIEWRTRSVTKTTAWLSVAGAAACVVFARSPIVAALVVTVAIAAGTLYLLRRAPAPRRTQWQLYILVGVAIVAGVVWAFRTQVIAVFNGGGQLNYRLDLWREMWTYIARHPLEGWGWTGRWPLGIPPFPAFDSSDASNSGLNAFLDAWLQVGLVGALILVGVIGLAFVRSWLLAGRRRSSVFAWSALVLVALIGASAFESAVLFESAWLIAVVCSVNAGREISWRRALTAADKSHPA